MEIQEEIIKTGKAIYDNTISYKIEIIKTNFKPGTGEYEDPPEIENDQFGEFYKIKYYSPPDMKYTAGGGYYDSLIKAIAIAEEKTGGINWEE